MFHMPMSSPKMTRMFGLRPDGAGCACACVTLIGAPVISADAAASVVPPSRILRRLRAFSFLLVSSRSFFVLILSSFSNDTSESDVARGRIHRFRMASGWAVTAAVVRRAQVRAAFEDLARNPDLGLALV